MIIISKWMNKSVFQWQRAEVISRNDVINTLHNC